MPFFYSRHQPFSPPFFATFQKTFSKNFATSKKVVETRNATLFCFSCSLNWAIIFFTHFLFFLTQTKVHLFLSKFSGEKPEGLLNLVGLFSHRHHPTRKQAYHFPAAQQSQFQTNQRSISFQCFTIYHHQKTHRIHKIFASHFLSALENELCTSLHQLYYVSHTFF